MVKIIDGAPLADRCAEQTWPYYDRRCLVTGAAPAPHSAAAAPSTASSAASPSSVPAAESPAPVTTHEPSGVDMHRGDDRLAAAEGNDAPRFETIKPVEQPRRRNARRRDFAIFGFRF
jgi:hypothetical protein